MDKLCKACGETKPAADFYTNKTKKDGLTTYCRPCHKTKVSANYERHPRWQAPEGFKKCTACKEVLPLDQFHNNKFNPSGKSWTCRPCSVASVTKSRRKDPTSHRRASKAWRDANPEQHADNSARWRYGLEHGTYTRMFEAQGGRCAVCKTDTPGGNAKRFHIDHCHDTGVVRGLLCTGCNNGLGRFKDNVDLLKSAAEYLRKTKAPPG